MATITDDDIPTLSIADQNKVESNTLPFEVTISAISNSNVTFDYVVVGGTAVSGVDYVYT